MSDDINYQNNPLHGISLKNVLLELVDHYGFDILNAYLSLNCFKTNPSIESSLKFLKKTDWAREKLESFYLYQYKSLPQPPKHEFEVSPRDRIIPQDQVPGEPAELSFEDAERLQEKRDKRTAEHNNKAKSSSPYCKGRNASTPYGNRPKSDNSAKAGSDKGGTDPWAKWR